MTNRTLEWADNRLTLITQDNPNEAPKHSLLAVLPEFAILNQFDFRTVISEYNNMNATICNQKVLIEELEKKVEEAKELNPNGIDIKAVNEKIRKITDALDNAKSDVEEALNAADNAQSNANEAEDYASSAKSYAEDATSDAEDASGYAKSAADSLNTAHKELDALDELIPADEDSDDE